MNLTRKKVQEMLPPDCFPLRGPLLVIAHFIIPVPKSVKGTKRQRQHRLPHMQKPDGDNLEKFLNDALNGVVWMDDARIVWMVRSKTLTKEANGETILTICELENSEPDYALLLETITNYIKIEE